MKGAEDPWFKIFKRNPTPRARIFCVPFAGGAPNAFFKWRDAFDEDELVVFHLPGRFGDSRAPISNSGEMTARMLEAISPYLDLPFVIYGHSMGGLLGFELARALRAAGSRAPEALIISGRRAPKVSRDNVDHTLSDDLFWAEIARIYNPPKALLEDLEVRDLFTPTFRADFELLGTWSYVETPPLELPIHVLAGADDDRARPQDMEGWREHTSCRFEQSIFPGGHMFIQSQQAQVLSKLQAIIGGLEFAGQPR